MAPSIGSFYLGYLQCKCPADTMLGTLWYVLVSNFKRKAIKMLLMSLCLECKNLVKNV